MDVFAEQGYSGATISEIERRVGLAVGTGSLYRHFPSKEALLREAVEYEVTRCRTEAESARAGLPHLGDPVERQVQRFRQALGDIQRFDRLFRLMLNDGARVPELADAVWTAVGRRLERRATSEEDVFDAIALTSLGGYHLFSLMQGRPFNGVPEEQLIRLLAELTNPAEEGRQPAAS
jgi:AcrR family transcriptional regulator